MRDLCKAMELGDVVGILMLAYLAYVVYSIRSVDRELLFIAILGFILVLAAFIGRYIDMDTRIGVIVVAVVVVVFLLLIVKR